MLLKRIVALAVLGSALPLAQATPLAETKVAADAKWVLHLDLDAFRQTQVGRYLLDDVIGAKFSEAQAENKIQFNTSPKNIHSVTAYGTRFGKEQEGVLLVHTTANVKKDIEALVGLAALDGNDKTESLKLEDASYLLYKINDDAFVAPDVNGTVLLARTRAQLEDARAVLAGEKQSVSGGELFAKYPKVEQSFFFLGAAEGFSQEGPVPPQAQVLQESDGGRLVIGESGENLFVNLVLRGKSPESTTKIQQVLQGIVALVSMAQDNPDIQQLAAGTSVAKEEQNVVVNLKVPVSKALAKIKEKQEHEEEEEEETDGSAE